MTNDNSKNIFNVSGNQVNIAPNGTINAIQNNGMNTDEVIRLIDNLKAAIPKETNEEDIETIKDSIAAIEEELKKQKPRKGFINGLLTGLKGIIRTAEFGAAAAAIYNFVQGLHLGG